MRATTTHTSFNKRVYMTNSHVLTPFLVLLLLLSSTVLADIVTVPLLGGAESGEYLMALNLGTPSQPFSVKVTTADYALMVPSEKCTRRSCRKRYVYTSSTTYQKIPCQPPCVCPNNANNSTECGFQELFGSTLVKGTVTRDVGQLDNYTMNFTFVRFDQRPPTLAPDSLADGIFGLSLWEPPLAEEQLLPQVTLMTHSENTAFSLCLGEFGGRLILGGLDEQYVNGNILWVPISQGQSQFTLDLIDITVGQHLSVTLPGTVYATIDSGTQYLQLPSNIFQGVKLLFRDLLCPNGVGPVGICGASNQTFFDGMCYIMDDNTINRFPSIELVFITDGSEQVILQIPPTNYFVDYRGKACLALEVSTDANVIIGNRIIQEYYTIFVPNNGTVGFAKAANCSGAQYKAEIVEGNGQQGGVGEKLSHPLKVKVVRLNDSEPVAGVNVTFNIVDTTIPTEAMWISHAIGMSQPARVDPAFVITSTDGTAETFLWLAGATYENTVSADIPLCLDHVIFTATGEQSYVWRIITYLFLGGLVIVVILLNFWYRKAMQRKKLYRSSLSVNTFDDHDSYFVGSPPQSPTQSVPPRPNFSNAEKGHNSTEEIEEEDEDPFQPPRRAWYDTLSWNTMQWHARRAVRRVQSLFKPTSASTRRSSSSSHF